MSQFACPSCSRVLKANPELAGKQVACTCGQRFRVPGGNTTSASSSPRSIPTTNGKVTLSCSCGKRLAAPLSARGKSVRCPCGQINKVPLADDRSDAPVVAAVAEPMAAGNDWLDDLPATPSTGYPSAPGMAMQGHANPYAGPAAAHPGAYSPHAPANPAANSHLANAQQQLANERRSGNNVDSGGSSFFSSGTMGGLFMMIAALVWFFGGLAAGVIFFYPPVLFVIGLVALIKGAMNDD